MVSELLRTCAEKCGGFRPFKVKGPKGEDGIVLSDDRVLDITVAGKPGELGFPLNHPALRPSRSPSSDTDQYFAI